MVANDCWLPMVQSDCYKTFLKRFDWRFLLVCVEQARPTAPTGSVDDVCLVVFSPSLFTRNHTEPVVKETPDAPHFSYTLRGTNQNPLTSS
jgi:hypothetical protein